MFCRKIVWFMIFMSFVGEPNLFKRPSRDGPYYVIGYGGRAGVHTGFRTITLVLYIGSLPILATWFPCERGRTLFILGSLGQRSPLLYINFWQQGRFHTITLVLYIRFLTNLATWFACGRGRTLFILRSKVKVTYYKYNCWQQGHFHMITLVLYIGSLPNLTTWLPCGRGRTLFTLGTLGQRSRSQLLLIEFVTTGSFPHDSFSSVYWIFTKLGHMIPLWKGKNPIYLGVITIIPFDNLYRRACFVMHTFLVLLFLLRLCRTRIWVLTLRV
jgi:hypothetical protein